jgi:hypothetical protein
VRSGALPAAAFRFGRAIAFRKGVSDPEGKGTPGEVVYDSHHGSTDVRNLLGD